MTGRLSLSDTQRNVFDVDAARVCIWHVSQMQEASIGLQTFNSVLF